MLQSSKFRICNYLILRKKKNPTRKVGAVWNQQTFPTDETVLSLHQSHTKTTSTEKFYYLTSWDSKSFTDVQQFNFSITAPASLQIQYLCIIQSSFTKLVAFFFFYPLPPTAEDQKFNRPQARNWSAAKISEPQLRKIIHLLCHKYGKEKNQLHLFSLCTLDS